MRRASPTCGEHRLFVAFIFADPALSPCLSPLNTGSLEVPKETLLTQIPYLFNQTIDDMRRIGARGGRARARNWRARQRAAGAAPREFPMAAAPVPETTMQAMAVLDAQFAWLRGAEKPASQRRSRLPDSGPC